MFELVVCKPDGSAIRRFDLSRLIGVGSSLLVGRGEDCHIRIKNGVISRRHCRIEALDKDEWVIRDLGSTHGMFVGDKRVAECDIEEGMEIRIGPALLRFETVASRIAADLERELGDEI